jgi:TPR repeat protein
MIRLVLITVLLVTVFTFAGCTDETKGTPTLIETPALVEASALAEAQSLAEAGNAEAQFKLGNLYAEGKVVPNDFAEAAKWFRKAGDQGHAEALYSLGIIYANGFSVPVDFAEGYVLFCLAAKSGFESATEDCDSLAGELSPEELALANKRIEEFNQVIESRE